MILNAEQLKEFREASEPMLKFLKKMGSPYLSAIFKDGSAELVNGVASNNLRGTFGFDNSPEKLDMISPLVRIEVPKLSDDTSAEISEAMETVKDNPNYSAATPFLILECKYCGFRMKKELAPGFTPQDKIDAISRSCCSSCFTKPDSLMEVISGVYASGAPIPQTSQQHDPLQLAPVGCAAVPRGTSKLQQEMDNNYKDIVITWKCMKCGHTLSMSFFYASTERNISAFEDTLEYAGCPVCLTIPGRFMGIPE